jgi:cytochrome P450
VKAASASYDPLISLLAPSRKVRPQRRRLAQIVEALISRERRMDRRGSPSAAGGLVALLLAEVGDGDIPEEVRDAALTILVAGHDTIASALAWAWTFLARHPQLQARLEQEVDAVLGARAATAADVPALVFTRAVLAESIRLYPPAWVIARSTAAELDLRGYRIPAGAVVLVSPYLLHRDDRLFPCPSSFDPGRWLDGTLSDCSRRSYIPFGAGPRACIGEGFAWTEGVLLIATFAQRWRFRLIDDPEILRPRAQMTLRPPEQVGMTIHARATGSSAVSL